MSKSYLWSALFAVAIIGWFASGYVLPAGSAADTSTVAQEAEQEAKAAPFKVLVNTFKAVERPSVFPVRGLTEASRQVEVRARTAGIVEDQTFEAGDAVKAGDVLCSLDMAARTAQLARAKAQLASAQRDYEASAQLAKSNFAAKSKVAQQKAAMELALAELQQSDLVLVDQLAPRNLFGIWRTRPLNAWLPGRDRMLWPERGLDSSEQTSSEASHGGLELAQKSLPVTRFAFSGLYGEAVHRLASSDTASVSSSTSGNGRHNAPLGVGVTVA